MTKIVANDLDFKVLNEQVKQAKDDVTIDGCFGQRFVGCKYPAGRKLIINGTPGNALGAYLDGGVIEVNGNAQDATGDTMNDGRILVKGSAGDALGYAMRGGCIFVQGDAGYRAGIHMKEYKDKKPVIIIGGKAGSFLGEYLAGGIIVVLGLNVDEFPCGNFVGTGMHGGKIFIRTEKPLPPMPAQVVCGLASKEDMAEIDTYLTEYAGHFWLKKADLLKGKFYVLKPNAKSPYKQLYVEN